MARVTHADMIFLSLSKIKRGTCAQISVHCRLTYVDIEKNIYKLINQKKVKVLQPKGGHSPKGKPANVYFILTNTEEEVSIQNELF